MKKTRNNKALKEEKKQIDENSGQRMGERSEDEQKKK